MLKIGIHGNDHIADRRIQPGPAKRLSGRSWRRNSIHMESGLEFAKSRARRRLSSRLPSSTNTNSKSYVFFKASVVETILRSSSGSVEASL